MYRILLAIDGSEHSKKVVDEARRIAEAMNAEVTVFNVVNLDDVSPRISVHMSDDYWDLIKKNLKSDGEKIVEKAAETLRGDGLAVKTEILIGPQSPADAICEKAKKDRYDLVVIGSRGVRGIKEAFLGSVSNKVAHCAGINVLIIK